MPEETCPCGTGRALAACCGPILAGARAATPEELMRSRYTAYAVGDVGHLIRTTAPDSPHAQPDVDAWTRELTAYCRSVKLHGLTVSHAEQDGDRGVVRFFARIQSGRRDVSFGERSTFVRDHGWWLYVDGVPAQA